MSKHNETSSEGEWEAITAQIDTSGMVDINPERLRAAFFACTGIPTSALSEGLLKLVLQALEGQQFSGKGHACADCGGTPATGHVVNSAGHPCRTGQALAALTKEGSDQ